MCSENDRSRDVMTCGRRPAYSRTRLAVACSAALILCYVTGATAVMATEHADSVNADGLVAATTLQQAPEAIASTVADQATAENTVSLSTVSVSATRILREGFIAPTPTTTISSADLKLSAATNVAQVLYQMPQIRPSLNLASTTNNSTASGSYFLDLRGLGPTRTLVLLDGHRLVPGRVDVSMIPQILIEGVDVVTGGASAAWGSDAVAGVINFRLDHSLQGVTGEVSGGVSGHHDRANNLFSIAYGTDFGGQLGHIELAAESSHNTGIPHLTDRGWGAALWGFVNNPAYTPTNDEPRRLLVRNQVAANRSLGGVINSGPLKGIQFAPGGEPIPFRYGDLVTATSMVGGDGANIQQTDQALEGPLSRKNLYGRAEYAFLPNLTGYVEGIWEKSRSIIPSLTSSDTSLVIHRDNAFLPPSIASAMDENGITQFTLGRYNPDYSQTINHMWTLNTKASGGLSGSFGETWTWNIDYGYSKTDFNLNAIHNRITPNFNYSIDSVIDPSTGAAVCRVDTGAAAGCIPINVFGVGSPSPQARSYVLGTASRDILSTMDTASSIVRGEPFSLFAGPVSVAAGIDWRRIKEVVTSDPVSTAHNFNTGNTNPWSGSESVREAFGEVVVPLAKQASWAQSLDLDIAVRRTNYSTSGSANTWKLGVDWQVNDLIRFRSTKSRDIRAPTLEELFNAGGTTIFGVLDPAVNQTYTMHSISTGNPNLKPEKADTTTAGIVFTPSVGVMFSLDYWKTDLNDAIIAFQAGDIVTRCYGSQPQLCKNIIRGPDGLVDHVNSVPENLQTMALRGVDLETAYSAAWGPGNFNVHGTVSYLDKFSLDDGISVTEMAGSSIQPSILSIGGQPHWKGDLSASYRVGHITVNSAAHYIGSAKLNNDWTSKDSNVLTNASQTYFDLGGSYQIYDSDGKHVELFASISNIFDRDPPITGAGGYITTRSLYEYIGRMYKAGMRFRF